MWRDCTDEWQSTPLDIYKRQETSADLLPFKKSTCGHKKYHNKNIDSTIAESMTAKEIIAKLISSEVLLHQA
jgi:hypothetical protein